jgi:putative spermidine/putrescine transport system substrate-binding protein
MAASARKDGPPLRVVGRSEILIEPIREQAARDLDFEVRFELIDDIEGLQRAVTRPDSFDVYHQWHTIDLVWTARTVQAIDLTRIIHGDEIKAKAVTGRGDGRTVETVFNKLFLHPDGKLGRNPSDRVSMLPSIHGVDAFGYLKSLRDEVDGAPDSWGWLFDARWQGRVGIMSDPVLGTIEAALATETAEGIAFADIGNLSIEEIDIVADLLLHKKKIGHFRGIWRNYEEAARFMQRGGVVLQSMFSPALARVRRLGMPVISAVPVEGYRGWHADLCISAHAEDEVLDAAYAYLNWWQSGWPAACLARQGYYTTLSERARHFLSAEEWAYWYEGRPAEIPLADPFGEICIQPGERREGGSHMERMARVRVWNTFMDEHTYLVRRWKEFLEG